MIYAKIQNIQSKIGKMEKEKSNPFFKSSYFDINQLLEKLQPLLLKEGLTLVQPMTTIGDRPSLTTIITEIDADVGTMKELIENGHMVQFTVSLPDIQDPQKMGSAITYYRRYALQSLFALQASDDDGNMASGRNVKSDNKVKSDNSDIEF